MAAKAGSMRQTAYNAERLEERKGAEAMTTVYDAIDHIRAAATSEKDKGTKFERLTRFFLKNDPLWKSRLTEV